MKDTDSACTIVPRHLPNCAIRHAQGLPASDGPYSTTLTSKKFHIHAKPLHQTLSCDSKKGHTKGTVRESWRPRGSPGLQEIFGSPRVKLAAFPTVPTLPPAAHVLTHESSATYWLLFHPTSNRPTKRSIDDAASFHRENVHCSTQQLCLLPHSHFELSHFQDVCLKPSVGLYSLSLLRRDGYKHRQELSALFFVTPTRSFYLIAFS